MRKMNKFNLIAFLPHFLVVYSSGIIPTGDFWPSVSGTQIFNNLTSCQQNCVLGVNTKVGCQGSGCCVSYGCVCSENTNGTNFLAAQSVVSDCSQSCPVNPEGLSALEALDDLCVVYNAALLSNGSAAPAPLSNNSSNATIPSQTSSFTLPGVAPEGKFNFNSTALLLTFPATNRILITSAGYNSLDDCSKFVLNGCKDTNGVRDESNCGPVYQIKNWEMYSGIADYLHCHNTDCLCDIPSSFNNSMQAMLLAGQDFCGMLPPVDYLQNADDRYANMANVFITFCSATGAVPHSWQFLYQGDTHSSK
jgi:hypothetical protein